MYTAEGPFIFLVLFSNSGHFISFRELVNAITNVETSKENTGTVTIYGISGLNLLHFLRTGFLHLLPNKGGICVTLTLGQTSFAFISCHLAAHEVRLLLHYSVYSRSNGLINLLGASKVLATQ